MSRKIYNKDYKRLQEVNAKLRDIEAGFIPASNEEYGALLAERGALVEKLFGAPQRDLIHAIKTGALLSAWQTPGGK